MEGYQRLTSFLMMLYATIIFGSFVSHIATISSASDEPHIHIFEIISPAVASVTTAIFGSIICTIMIVRKKISIRALLVGLLLFASAILFNVTDFVLALAIYLDKSEQTYVYISYITITFFSFVSSLGTLIWLYYTILYMG